MDNIDIIANFLKEHYTPAATLKDADITISTSEVLKNLARHTGYEFLVYEVHDALVLMEYKTQDIGEMEMVWLIRRKVVL